MKVERIGQEQVYFEYRFAGEYVRRLTEMSALTEFLTGNPAELSNLGPNGEQMLFEVFARDIYLPKSAKNRLKPRSFSRQTEMITALERFFKGKLLHKITLEDWDSYKDLRLSGKLSIRKPTCSEGTVIKEFKCFRMLLTYAVATKYLRWNVVGDVKLGLADGNRSDIWLTKKEIPLFLGYVPDHIRLLFEFRIWTGARPEEAALFGVENINWESGQIWILTLKKRRRDPGRIRRRYFRIKSLGPRFEELLKSLVPDPDSKLFFVNPETGRPYAPRYVQQVFKNAIAAAKIVKRVEVTPYDLRGTFAMHRGLVVKEFRQLQTELGQLDPKSVQHYLDEASHHDPRESIFYGVDVSAVAPAVAPEEEGK